MPPSNTDITPGFDPTGYPSISGAQLLQFLALAIPYSDKGLALSTSDTAGIPDVPNAVTTAKWQKYIWLRVSATAVVPYVWNPAAASDVTYLKWQSVAQSSIGVGSIVNAMIADNTIQDIKIANLSYSKLIGAPVNLPPSGAAGGVLTGTYPNPSIANAAITTAMVGLLQITDALIASATISVGKLAPVSGAAKDMARVNAGATGMEAFTPPVVFTSGVVVPTANSLKVPQVNTGATDFQMVAPTTLGRVLQVVETLDTAADTTALNPALNALPTNATCKVSATCQVSITPINAASNLYIEVGMEMTNSAGDHPIILALFQDAVVNALAAVTGTTNNTSRPQMIVLRFTQASGSLVARTFKAGFGSDGAGNTRINSTDGATKLFGGALGSNSWIRVMEVI